MRVRCTRYVAALVMLIASLPVLAQCPPQTPVQGAPPSFPIFPSDNWWNVDISNAPVDVNSPAYISFINNGGTRRLHPDFGGQASAGSVAIYGMPYAIVDGSTPKQS